MFDIIITGARVYDGRGGEPYATDVAVQGDRIARIGDCGGMDAALRLDASGLSLLPGFIDVHTHSDAVLFARPEREEAIRQGITTELTGSCGIGLFPLDKAYDDYEPTMRGIMGKSASRTHYASAGAFLAALPATGINVAAQLAHSPLRAEAIGYSDQPLIGKGLDKALSLARESLEEGAVSLTTGLSYYPASFGDTDELVALSKVAALFDVPLCAHLRSVLRRPDPSFDKRYELLAIARRSGVRAHFSHYRTIPEAAGKLDDLFAPIEQGLSEGLRVTADFYPYPIGSGFSTVHLPLWAMDGGFASIMARLRDPSLHAKIAQDLPKAWPPIDSGVILHSPHHPEYLGRSYGDIASRRNQTVAEMLADLLEEEELEVGFRPEIAYTDEQERRLEDDFPQILAKPYYMAGSDTLAAHMLPHPRTFGAFAKLVRLCHERGVPLGLVANRLSRNAAQLFQLKDRGEIAEGKYADICLFNPEVFRDQTTFSDPLRFSTGMTHVLVNGRFALRDGVPTGVRAGRALYRGK